MVRARRDNSMWRIVVPLAGIVLAVAVPLTHYAQKGRAERAAVRFLTELTAAQERFRTVSAAGGYASDLTSLTTPCPGSGAQALAVSPAALTGARYNVHLRAAEGARVLGADCHGRALASDYYAAAEPMSAETPAEQAFAVTSTGRIFVFFDRRAPRERDMAAGGLATPLEALKEMTIP
jgi:Tfp pilus assembly protein PilE